MTERVSVSVSVENMSEASAISIAVVCRWRVVGRMVRWDVLNLEVVVALFVVFLAVFPAVDSLVVSMRVDRVAAVVVNVVVVVVCTVVDVVVVVVCAVDVDVVASVV